MIDKLTAQCLQPIIYLLEVIGLNITDIGHEICHLYWISICKNTSLVTPGLLTSPLLSLICLSTLWALSISLTILM